MWFLRTAPWRLGIRCKVVVSNYYLQIFRIFSIFYVLLREKPASSIFFKLGIRLIYILRADGVKIENCELMSASLLFKTQYI